MEDSQVGSPGRQKSFGILERVPQECDSPGMSQLQRSEQLRGLRRCLRSKRTPSWLKPAITRYLRKLDAQVTVRNGGRGKG
jgi:hypothetical protein